MREGHCGAVRETEQVLHTDTTHPGHVKVIIGKARHGGERVRHHTVQRTGRRHRRLGHRRLRRISDPIEAGTSFAVAFSSLSDAAGDSTTVLRGDAAGGGRTLRLARCAGLHLLCDCTTGAPHCTLLESMSAQITDVPHVSSADGYFLRCCGKGILDRAPHTLK